VVLDTLAQAERLAFVLHDMFAVPFGEIASMLDRSPNAAKQLASRARQRVRAADATAYADVARQTQLVNAFLAASRDGDFAALLGDWIPTSCSAPTRQLSQAGALAEVRGAPAVARQLSERAVTTLPMLVVETPEPSQKKAQATPALTTAAPQSWQLASLE
jgi:RNA polymerase sigma-70 factor (ECF subfamily)